MKTEIHEQCTICYKIMDSTNPTKITEEILGHLMLNTNISSVLLQQALICDTCLVTIKSACNFKTSYIDLLYSNIKSEEGGCLKSMLYVKFVKILSTQVILCHCSIQ